MNARKVVWVLVCDAARARFYEVHEGNPAWTLVSAVSHDESRAKASELVSDHSGRRSPEGAGAHHNALAPASSPKDVEKAAFAHALGNTLDAAMRAASFGGWVLVAAPHFAGMVTKELTSELAKHLLSTVHKDMSHVGMPELATALGNAVHLPGLVPPASVAPKHAH